MFFKDVIGQEEIKEKLIQNVVNGRISHTQLFLGPEGSGKLALAIAFARYLACTYRTPKDACGTCHNCIKYNKLAHPDLNFFYPIPSKKVGGRQLQSKDFATQWLSYLESSPYVSLNAWYQHIAMENKQGQIFAEDCNEVIKVLSYKPYESEYKVVIMWMIERLYHAAAPKLLKVLEEPPDKTIILLVSENQEQILNTILSRSQLVKIPFVSEEELKNGLINQYGTEPSTAAKAAFIADGNFYTALALSRNDESLEGNTQLLREWLRHCYRYNPAEIVNLMEGFAGMGREKQKRMLATGVEIFRQSILINYNTPELVKAHPDAEDFIRKFSNILSPEMAMQMSHEFSQAIYHVERNANPKILFTDLSMKAARIMNKAKK